MTPADAGTRPRVLAAAAVEVAPAAPARTHAVGVAAAATAA